MKKIILTGFALITIFSCSNENTDIIRDDKNISAVDAQRDFMKFFNSNAKNQILIESIGSIYGGEKIQNITSRTLGTSEPLGFILNGKTMTGAMEKNSFVNSWVSSNISIDNFFGKKISFKLLNGKIVANELKNGVANKGGDSGEGTELYIPETINATIYGLVDGKVVPGTTITWNKDELNENGITMAVEYSPYTQRDETIAQKNKENVTRISKVDDIGSYTVTKEDLENFPSGASLAFYVGRMAYTVEADGTIKDDTSIGAYTAVRADFDISYQP